MAERITHHGGCHCGAVRFEVDAAIDAVISCNCSICSKRGSLLAFAPASDFRLLSGEAKLKDYQFGKKRIHHLFCSDCGTESFGRGIRPDGAEMVAFNVRCLDDVDVSAFPVRPFDGRSL
jgi:hypothetical protein